MPAKPQAYLFDAYGTLFDVDSVMRRGGIQGDLQALSQLWRRKQLEYTWQRALMERYEDFWTITEAALQSAIRQLSIQATPGQIQSLMQAYLSLDAFDDVKPALEALKGSPRAILSNGTSAMLDSLIRHNGLPYPPQRTPILLHRSHLRRPPQDLQAFPARLRPRARNPEAPRPGEILFVSSNQWDAAGAQSAIWLPGLRWVQPVRRRDRRSRLCSRRRSLWVEPARQIRALIRPQIADLIQQIVRQPLG